MQHTDIHAEFERYASHQPRQDWSILHLHLRQQRCAGLKGVTTANSKRGGINYNLNMNKRMFVFGAVDLETDQFQELDLRFVPSGGAGYHAIVHENTSFDLFGGVAANREFFSTGLQRTSAEILLGEELVHSCRAARPLGRSWYSFPMFPMAATIA